MRLMYPIDRWLVIRESLSRTTRIILGVIPIALILVLWQLATSGATPEDRLIPAMILPSPTEVVLAIGSLWFEAELSRSVVATTLRVLAGFAVALLIAFPLGILMGSFSKVKALFDPLTTFGSYLPWPTLVPLTMSLFGTDELQKIMFLAIAFVIFLLPMFVKAIGEVDEVYLQTAQTLGATKWQLVRHVLLGVSLSELYDTMRRGFGVGWTYVILAEMLVIPDRGLGHIVTMAQRRGPREHIYLVLLVIFAIAFVTDYLLVKLGKRLFPYRESA